MATQTITHGTRIPASPHKGNWKLLLALGAFLIAGAVLFAAIQLIGGKDPPTAAPSNENVQIEAPEMNRRIAPDIAPAPPVVATAVEPPAPAAPPVAPSVLQNAQSNNAPVEVNDVMVHPISPDADRVKHLPEEFFLVTIKEIHNSSYFYWDGRAPQFDVPLTIEGLKTLPWE